MRPFHWLTTIDTRNNLVRGTNDAFTHKQCDKIRRWFRWAYLLWFQTIYLFKIFGVDKFCAQAIKSLRRFLLCFSRIFRSELFMVNDSFQYSELGRSTRIVSARCQNIILISIVFTSFLIAVYECKNNHHRRSNKSKQYKFICCFFSSLFSNGFPKNLYTILKKIDCLLFITMLSTWSEQFIRLRSSFILLK